MALWTPANLPTPPVGWWDALSPETITKDANNAVSAWANKGSGASAATQATASRQPTYSSSGFGGFPGIVVNGVTNLQIASFTGFPIGSADSTIIVVAQVDSNNSTFGRLFAYGNTGTDRSVLYAGTSREVGMLMNGGGVYTSGSTWQSTRRMVHVESASVAGGGANNNTLIVDTTITVTQSRTMATSNTACYIGAAPTANNIAQATIAEIIVIPAILSFEDRQKMEGYLTGRWGMRAVLLSNHPFKTSSPEFFAPIAAAASITTANMTALGVGKLPIVAQQNAQLGALTVSATAALQITASATITLNDARVRTDTIRLGHATVSATGTLPIAARQIITLDDMQAIGAGNVVEVRNADALAYLADLTATSTVHVEISGIALITLDDATIKTPKFYLPPTDRITGASPSLRLAIAEPKIRMAFAGVDQ